MKTTIIVMLLLVLLVPVVSFANVPAFPMAFYGSVSVNGVPAPANSLVRVYVNGVEVGSITTYEQGIYGYSDLSKQRLLVEESDGELVFTIQSSQVNGGLETKGVNPISYPSFESGMTIQKNLNFQLGTVNNNNQSSGKSSSGGGGGGGGSSKKKSTIETPAPIVLGVSISADDATARIELQKQIIILLTQLITLLKQQMLLKGLQ